MARRHARPNATMQPGDTVVISGTLVTILSDPTPCEDRFGQSLYRSWATRQDTGAEGWLDYGWKDDES